MIALKLTTEAKILDAIRECAPAEVAGALDPDDVAELLDLDRSEVAAARVAFMHSLRTQLQTFGDKGAVEIVLVQLLGPDMYEKLLGDLANHLLQTLIQ